jgi:hypothetical protein
MLKKLLNTNRKSGRAFQRYMVKGLFSDRSLNSRLSRRLGRIFGPSLKIGDQIQVQSFPTGGDQVDLVGKPDSPGRAGFHTGGAKAAQGKIVEVDLGGLALIAFGYGQTMTGTGFDAHLAGDTLALTGIVSRDQLQRTSVRFKALRIVYLSGIMGRLLGTEEKTSGNGKTDQKTIQSFQIIDNCTKHE